MKKLVAVSAMAALLAGAAFAADINGGAKIKFNVFDYSTQSKDWNVFAFPIKSYAYGDVKITVSDEKTSATLNVTDDSLSGSISFKPLDILTLEASIGDFAANVSLDALTLGGSVGTQDTGADAVLDKTYTQPAWAAYVGYNLEDVGSVKVTGAYNKVEDREGNNDGDHWIPVAGYGVVAEVSTSVIPSTSLSLRGGYYNTEKKADLVVEATETVGELSIYEKVQTTGYIDAGYAELPAYAEVGIPAGELKVKPYVSSDDLLKATEASASAGVELSGTYGVVAWTAAFDVTGSADEECTVSVPVTFKVNF